MIWTIPKAKVEYGDFQTPIELAELICQKLIELGINPDVIIEPTCGVGNFIDASSRLFRSTDKILGVEINPHYTKNLNLAYCASYSIDAKKYFNASVESCLLFCKFDGISTNYFCDVFDSLESTEYQRIGYRHNILVRDVVAFDKVSELYHPNPELKWRSGVKHDCSSVMELRKVDKNLINGFGDIVDIEDTYLFPLLKGSDVA
jgi:hypothetical protein